MMRELAHFLLQSPEVNFARLLCFACAAFVFVHPLRGELIAEGELPASTKDALGGTSGSFGSGIAWDAKAGRLFCVSDRGPDDGHIAYRPRLHVLSLERKGSVLLPKILKTVILRDREGREMTGLIPDDTTATTPRMVDGRTCIDPEAIAIAPDGSLFISDEYAPAIYRFDQDGRMLNRLDFPRAFEPLTARGTRDFGPDAKLIGGRAPNQGPEGMCLLHDGKTLAAIFQSGLVQDGSRTSASVRFVLMDATSGELQGDYAYPLGDPEGHISPKKEKISVHELVSLDASHFLVLERDGKGRDGSLDPKPAKYKAVYLADISRANQETMVKKTLLFNLPDVTGISARALSAKWEGLATMGLSPDRRSADILIVSDNDFLTQKFLENGTTISFERVKEEVGTQFFLLRVPLELR